MKQKKEKNTKSGIQTKSLKLEFSVIWTFYAIVKIKETKSNESGVKSVPTKKCRQAYKLNSTK
jgi:hypothetical protein